LKLIVPNAGVKVVDPRHRLVGWKDVLVSFGLKTILLLIVLLVFANDQPFFGDVDKAASIYFNRVLFVCCTADPVGLLLRMQLINLPSMVYGRLDVNYIMQILHPCKMRDEFYSVIYVSRVSLQDLWNGKVGYKRRFALLTAVI